MSRPRGFTPELEDLLGALRESRLEPEQAARLDQLLSSDPDARTYYLHYVELCSTLHHYQGTSIPDRRGASSTADGSTGNKARRTAA